VRACVCMCARVCPYQTQASRSNRTASGRSPSPAPHRARPTGGVAGTDATGPRRNRRLATQARARAPLLVEVRCKARQAHRNQQILRATSRGQEPRARAGVADGVADKRRRRARGDPGRRRRRGCDSVGKRRRRRCVGLRARVCERRWRRALHSAAQRHERRLFAAASVRQRVGRGRASHRAKAGLCIGAQPAQLLRVRHFHLRGDRVDLRRRARSEVVEAPTPVVGLGADGEPSPGADVAGASPVPEQMWQGRARSRSRCGPFQRAEAYTIPASSSSGA
jgi:hypothetical protein